MPECSCLGGRHSLFWPSPPRPGSARLLRASSPEQGAYREYSGVYCRHHRAMHVTFFFLSDAVAASCCAIALGQDPFLPHDSGTMGEQLLSCYLAQCHHHVPDCRLSLGVQWSAKIFHSGHTNGWRRARITFRGLLTRIFSSRTSFLVRRQDDMRRKGAAQ